MTYQSKKTSPAISITAQNTFSTPIILLDEFAFSVAGVTNSTVVVQRSPDASTWTDVKTLTAATIASDGYGGVYSCFEPARDISYRFGVKTGGYGSDTITGGFAQ